MLNIKGGIDFGMMPSLSPFFVVYTFSGKEKTYDTYVNMGGSTTPPKLKKKGFFKSFKVDAIGTNHLPSKSQNC